MSFSSKLKIFFLFFFALTPMFVRAQQPAAATVRGLVTDPDDAVIPGATVTLTPASGKGKAQVVQSQSDGAFTLHGVPAGAYSITVTMQGFATFVKMDVRVSAGQALTQNVKMAIQAQTQEVQVTAQSAQVGVDSDSNASSTVIKGKDLDALSDDPDELSSELSALAGPAAGPNGGQIYVDGFTGGQLPPKSSIREIRINQNPFSAQYDRLGYGRVEVFTKPGTDKIHGQYSLTGNDSSFNSGNPLLNSNLSPGQQPIVQPPYHSIFMFGNLSGPISRIASYSIGGSHRSIQDNTIVNAVVPASLFSCPAGQATCSYQAATLYPQVRTDISPRLDLALGEKNTLTARFQYYQNDIQNDGVGGFDLPSTGYNLSSSENTIQISDTQIVSPRIINETRFEYERDSSTQTAQNTTPTVSVQGAFTSGGSNAGNIGDIENHFEVQNYTSIQLQKNFIRFGGRLRTTSDLNTTTSGTNGMFTYNCLLTTDCTASYASGNASQFTITQVFKPVNATMVDVGLYVEDDWKPRPNLTLSYGLRYETQNHLNGNQNLAPRVSFAYGLGSPKGTPKTVLRGGFGMFYDRFNLTNITTTVRQDGVHQVQTTLASPDQTTCSPTNLSGCTAGTPGGQTTWAAASNLRAPYTMQFAVGADQQLFRGATLSLNYLNARGVHQFISQNVNAPTSFDSNGNPLTWPVQPATGTQPLIQKEFQSAGVFRQNQLIANVNIRSSRYFTVGGYYVLNFAKSDTAGATSFPSVPRNIGEDYGRATFGIRNRAFIYGSVTLPYHISLSPFLVASSGTPYNLTVGSDLNHDSIFNDRPAFASGTSGNCSDVNSFTRPGTGLTTVPINYCTAKGLFTMNLRVGKTFGFGEPTGQRVQGGQQDGGGRGGPGGPGGPGGGRGGPGGGGGRGGPGGPGGGGGASTGKRYNLTFSGQFQNLFATDNFGAPGSVLNSPQNFGKYTQLAGQFYTSNAALRRILLQMTFNF